MKRRFSEEQIIGILKQQEGSLSVVELCRQQNISEAGLHPNLMPVDVRDSRFVFVPRDRAVSG